MRNRQEEVDSSYEEERGYPRCHLTLSNCWTVLCRRELLALFLRTSSRPCGCQCFRARIANLLAMRISEVTTSVAIFVLGACSLQAQTPARAMALEQQGRLPEAAHA